MRELPAGTVTFLFTDVEGSTQLLQERGDQYPELLADHRRRLREAFARHGGFEVDTQGDAFFVAFARASDALAAATEAQAALVGGPIRVRIGIHTGEPLVTDEGYVGIDVNRAARIAAAAHGGQVLLSQATYDLAGGEALRDLGEHRLKDLTHAERIWQLGEGMFPPLKSLNQTNLPVQPTPFVGRERELGEVTALLRANRVVTLTGSGGSGKTRLALQAAAELIEDFADGVWFVSLAPISQPELVLFVIARTLRVPETPGLSLLETLKAALAQKRLLLLVDNFEHLLTAAPPIASLLAAAPALKLVVTSRARLALSGEHEYPVPPLAEDDAIALFRARARELKHDFEVDETVGEICRRLDGLPLAIELAAARIKVLKPPRILERLEHRLDLLTGGARDLPERQRTLRAAVGWSYELLDDRDRRLFERLAVFAGSFDLDTAESVCGADLDALSSLVDMSLLRQTEEGRFFMLETIREYALERFESTGDHEEVRRRHADRALLRARAPADHHELPEWRAAVERDYPDFRGTLTWLRDTGDDLGFLRLASRLGLYWDSRQHLKEGRLWLEQAVAVPLGVSPERAHALARLGHIAWRQGDAFAARSSIDAAEAEARKLGDEMLLAKVHSYRGSLEATSGNLTAARAEYEKAVGLFRAHAATAEVAIVIHDLGLIALEERDYPRARAHLEESLRLAREYSLDRFETSVLMTFGYLELEEGRVDRASRVLKEGLRKHMALERDVVVPWLADALYALAAATALQNDATTACMIVGTCDAGLDLVGAAREPAAERARTKALLCAERQIDRDAAERARALGSKLTLVEAVEFVLSLD